MRPDGFEACLLSEELPFQDVKHAKGCASLEAQPSG
jgi:hypothetical protein